MERQDTDFTAALTKDVRGMRIGIPASYFGEGLDPEVAGAVKEAGAGACGRGVLW